MLAADAGRPGRSASPHHQCPAPLDKVDHCLGRFPAWVVGQDPTKRIICASYADDLTRKLPVDTCTVIDNPWYREHFPPMQLAAPRPRNTDLITTRRGTRYATGMGRSILDRGADLIVIDDHIKATDTLSEKECRRVNKPVDDTFYRPLNDMRTGAIVIIMQRLQQDDRVGHLLGAGLIPAIELEERAYQPSDDSANIYIRRPSEVLHAAREPREIPEQMRRSQGSLTLSAQVRP